MTGYFGSSEGIVDDAADLCTLSDVTSNVASLREAIAVRSKTVPCENFWLFHDDALRVSKADGPWKGVRMATPRPQTSWQPNGDQAESMLRGIGS
jgi:hypothetical protein